MANNPVWIIAWGRAHPRCVCSLRQGFETLLQSCRLQVQSDIGTGELQKCEHRLQRWGWLPRTEQHQHTEGLLQAVQRHGEQYAFCVSKRTVPPQRAARG